MEYNMYIIQSFLILSLVKIMIKFEINVCYIIVFTLSIDQNLT